MILNQHRSAIALFPTLQEAGQAFDQLVLSGFSIAQVFLVGKELNDRPAPTTAHPIVDLAKANAITGTPLGLKKGLLLGNVLGSAGGCLLGLGILSLPGIGQIALGSAIVFTLLSGGICTAAGGMIGALIGLGLTSEQAKNYSHQVAEGHFLLVVEGTQQEILRAKQLLNTQGIQR